MHTQCHTHTHRTHTEHTVCFHCLRGFKTVPFLAVSGGKYKINDGITSFTLSDLEHRLNSAVFFFMTVNTRSSPCFSVRHAN